MQLSVIALPNETRREIEGAGGCGADFHAPQLVALPIILLTFSNTQLRLRPTSMHDSRDPALISSGRTCGGVHCKN